MAYDRELADRLRELLADEPDLSEQSMFGGLAFLIDGKMAIATPRGRLRTLATLEEVVTNGDRASRHDRAGLLMPCRSSWVSHGSRAAEQQANRESEIEPFALPAGAASPRLGEPFGGRNPGESIRESPPWW